MLNDRLHITAGHTETWMPNDGLHITTGHIETWMVNDRLQVICYDHFCLPFNAAVRKKLDKYAMLFFQQVQENCEKRN